MKEKHISLQFHSHILDQVVLIGRFDTCLLPTIFCQFNFDLRWMIKDSQRDKCHENIERGER